MRILVKATLFLGIGVLIAGSCEKQDPPVIVDSNPYHSILFYNVENLFDTLDHPEKPDEEFTPEGDKEWNTQKYYHKINKIGRVLKEIGTEQWPVVIGLCEIENRQVLEDLILSDQLAGADYAIVHKESPDYRGIDVALLYRPNLFNLIDYHAWSVWFPFDINYSTREVLYVVGELAGMGKLHVLVNHWPSRSGGEIETRPKRIFVAEMVRTKIDSILSTEPDARIVVTGDFNDEPNDLSIVSGLSAWTDFKKPKSAHLYAISHDLQINSEIGSYKYKGNWNMLDQYVVSGSLLDTTKTLYCRPTDLSIISYPFLLETDKTYMGKKPMRSFLGDYYQGGYSDHLPVQLNLRYRE